MFRTNHFDLFATRHKRPENFRGSPSGPRIQRTFLRADNRIGSYERDGGTQDNHNGNGYLPEGSVVQSMWRNRSVIERRIYQTSFNDDNVIFVPSGSLEPFLFPYFVRYTICL